MLVEMPIYHDRYYALIVHSYKLNFAMQQIELFFVLIYRQVF